MLRAVRSAKALIAMGAGGGVNRLSRWLGSAFRGAWGEHGAWAVGLISAAAGLGMARSLEPGALLLLPATAFLIGAKGLAARYRRTGGGLSALLVLAGAGVGCSVPAAIRAPEACGALAATALPFAALYYVFSNSPRWTRSLAVELLGTLLLASSSGLPIAVARKGAYGESLCAWALFGVTFLPGVLRARLPKSRAVALKAACTLCAAGGLALLAAYVAHGRMAWWGLVAAPPIAKEAYRAWALPDWSTRELGVNLTLKALFVALAVALSWQPGPL
jgi:hypothetical protein